MFKTHDFSGVTIYECPSPGCKFDSEKISVVKAHYWNTHQRHLAPAPVTIFGPDGELITSSGDQSAATPPQE